MIISISTNQACSGKWRIAGTYEDTFEYRRNDDLTTRENVSIENLLETDLVCEESVEDEYIREEEERQQYADGS